MHSGAVRHYGERLSSVKIFMRVFSNSLAMKNGKNASIKCAEMLHVLNLQNYERTKFQTKLYEAIYLNLSATLMGRN